MTFIFRAAFVETPKHEFFNTLKTFKMEDSFDLKQQFFGRTIDLLQTKRVFGFSMVKRQSMSRIVWEPNQPTKH